MILHRLKDHLIASGCNQQEQVLMLIEAHLGDGASVGSDIVRTISDLGYDRRFVGIQLSASAGSNPDRYPWRKSEDGTYCLH